MGWMRSVRGGLSRMTDVSSWRVGMLGMLNASSRRGRVMGGTLDAGILLGSISERVVCRNSQRVDMLDTLDTNSRRGRNLGGMLSTGIWLSSLSERMLMSSRQVSSGIRLSSLYEPALMSSRRVGMLGLLNTSSRRAGFMGGMRNAGILLGGRMLSISAWLSGLLGGTLIIGMLDTMLFSCLLVRNITHPGLHKKFEYFIVSLGPFFVSFVF